MMRDPELRWTSRVRAATADRFAKTRNSPSVPARDHDGRLPVRATNFERRWTRVMNKSGASKVLSAVFFFTVVVALSAAVAEETKIEGVIVGRSGDVIIVEYMQGAELAFHLDDATKVSQTGGVFKTRRTDKSMAALVPGLKVKVEGESNQDRKLVATS